MDISFDLLMNAIVAAWNLPTTAIALGDSGELYRYAIETVVDETTPARFEYLVLEALEGSPDFAFTLAAMLDDLTEQATSFLAKLSGA